MLQIDLRRGEKKRGRDGEEGSDNEEVALSVLKRLDGKLNTFLTKSREQVKNRLMDSFWVFLLSEKVNPRLSLTDVLDGRVKRYGDIEETDHEQNLSTEHNRRNMARYDALLESDELRFQVKYDVQVSDVPRSGQQSACFIRDMSQNVMKGSGVIPWLKFRDV
jgi:hypothetical protein